MVEFACPPEDEHHQQVPSAGPTLTVLTLTTGASAWWAEEL